VTANRELIKNAELSLPAKGLSPEAWDSAAKRREREMKRNWIKEKIKLAAAKRRERETKGIR